MKKLNTTTVALIVSIFLFTFPFISKAQENQASPSDEIRKKVQEKINKISQKPRAFIGTITDISESTIQISRFALAKKSEEKANEILQITYNKDTTIIDSREKSKQIKAQELAIGDFIIAMGMQKNGNILESSRILSIKPITPTKRASLKLTIQEIKKQEISANSQKGDLYTIKIEKDTKFIDQEGKETKIDNLENEKKIIVSGKTENKEILARTIFLLE